MARLPALLLLLLLPALALALPAVASAHHKRGHQDRWEDWRPVLDESEEDDLAWDDAAPVLEEGPDAGGGWFDDLEDSGDEAPAARGKKRSSPTRRTTRRAPAIRSSALRGVPYRSLILAYARRRGLEPALVAAVIHAESNFNRRAVSRAGARGLMQLMPATARGMGARVTRLFDPQTNIAFGTLYLARVRSIVGPGVRLMAAAYNAGPGAVRRFRGVPPYAETRHYVTRVAALRAAYARR